MEGFTVSRVRAYNFEMPKYVHIQINGVEKPARIRADKVEKREDSRGTLLYEKFTVMRENEIVGEFKADSIAGWWIEDEHMGSR